MKTMVAFLSSLTILVPTIDASSSGFVVIATTRYEKLIPIICKANQFELLHQKLKLYTYYTLLYLLQVKLDVLRSDIQGTHVLITSIHILKNMAYMA